VAEQLMSQQIQLGGEELEVTVLFADIRNFTQLCETLPPVQTLALLNRYLTAISAVIEEEGGVIDKYMGDGVMALFGAPISHSDDAARTLVAAMRIVERVAALADALRKEGLPHPDIGIGINTARVIAGNIGSPTRLNYTVLGDGVNLAARLEGLTKRYQVPIVVGEATRNRISGWAWRELDKVRVKGKSVPVRIHQPLGEESRIGEEERRRLKQYHDALESYRSRRWDDARTAFTDLAGQPGYSRLATLYLGYIENAVSVAPEANWDGAFTLYEK
jgi:adenylate cyclase